MPWWRSNSREQDLDRELSFDLELEAAEQRDRGLSAEQARHAAMRAFGNLTLIKEDTRAMWGWLSVERFLQDLRFSMRLLAKSPGFACTAIFVLALGISAVAAVFGFVDAALIRPLPYRDQSHLVAVFESSPGYARSIVSYCDFADWKALNRVFISIDAYALNGGFTLSTGTGAEQVTGTRVSAGFFRTLGVTPALGRDFYPGEDAPSAVRTVLLSYSAWQKRFGSRPDVLGRTVTLNGDPGTIIGVLPRDFHYGAADFFATLRSSDSCEQHRECHNLVTIARLSDGVSVQTATANMQLIAQQLQKQYPDANRDFGSVNLVPLRDLMVGDIRPILLVLLSGAGLLLLMTYANVAALLVARSGQRRREIAVRGALGASSSRLFRQFAAEGLALAGMGGLLGLVFADWGTRFLTSLVPAQQAAGMPFLRGAGLNPLTIMVACFISLVGGVLFAMIPMARSPLSQAPEGLKEGTRANTGTTWRRFGSNLVVIEVAIAMVLMVGAGLLGKSLYLLLHVATGFSANHLALVQTAWSPASYNSDREKTALGRQVVDRISAIPGIKSVAISLAPPIGSDWGTTSFHIAGRPNHGEHNEVLNRQVSSGYFGTLQARLLRGRYFRKFEDASKPLVAIVNRTLANRYFPGEDPVGKQIYNDWQPQQVMQIVGLVDDIREGALEGAMSPALYVPYDQSPVAWFAVLVRTSPTEASLFPSITTTIHGIDPFISVSGEETMTERIDRSPSAYLHRSSAWLVGAFAAAAFLLSVVGLYGVVAYSVSQRTREIGVRMALGAQRGTVYRLILSEAGRLIAGGVVLGLACSLVAARLLRSLLFGVGSWDSATLIGVVAVVGISALLASYIPARRAADVDPISALRSE